MARMRLHVPGFTAVPVRAPDGSVWDVGVEWLPRTPRLLPRWRRSGLRVDPQDVLGAAVDAGDDVPGILTGVVVGIAAALALVVLVVVVLPALVLVVDVLVLVAAALVAVAAKIVLRRPWRVVARCASGPSAGEVSVREVVGARAARRARDELRTAVAQSQSRLRKST